MSDQKVSILLKQLGISEKELDLKKIKAENIAMKKQITCKICLEKPSSRVLLPCGHLAACDVCIRKLTNCPICQKIILGICSAFW